MQISDMLGQYNRNVANGTEELRGAQGVQKLVSTVGDLSAGSVFEGTVNSVKNGKVTLALGNGQTISARLEGKVDIKPGNSMFFQVRSNDGLTVSIRPYTGGGSASNPILFQALTAAQIPATERTLAMVDTMMQEQMPVNRQSILDMVKVLNSNPNANVQTIVQMVKLGMPVTEAMTTQFEHYLSDQHTMVNEMELALGQVAEAIGDEALLPEDAVDLYNRIMDIFKGDAKGVQGGGMQLVDGRAGTAMQAQAEMTDQGAQAGMVPAGSAGEVEPSGGRLERAGQMAVDELLQGAGQTQAGENSGQIKGQTGQFSGQVVELTLGDLLSDEQRAALTKAIQNVPTLAGDSALFVPLESEAIFVDTMQDESIGVQGGQVAESAQQAADVAVLKKDMPVTEFLSSLQRAFAENSQYGYAGVQRLFAGKEFQSLLRHMVEQQWLIKPQDLNEEHKISQLYEKMEHQIRQMESAIRMTGITQNSFLHTAADIRGNIEFMNQMNQIYNYIQMPLKMSGQNANGELYVYRNKKQFDGENEELTAFLHLDMGNLGSTDVSVRMQNRQVKTNFYFEDDASYAMVEKHLPILEKRLKNKGYNCTITITNEKKNINFKENFVKRGRVSAGSLHRYSFDVRA